VVSFNCLAKTCPFAVADDDQIIYQWAGASYRQIAAFRKHLHLN
jgi:superfamily I DNA/RNA helicase